MATSYQLSIEETFQSLETRPEGLTPTEVERNLKLYGPNILATGEKEPVWRKILTQLKDFLAVTLLVAGILSLFMQEYRDATILFLIVFINSLIGFIQEFKAEKAIAALKSMVKSRAKVIREGKEIEIDAEELVPGDLVRLEEGDAVPADLRIIKENNIATNDFALTGESNPTKKFIHAIHGEVQLCDRNNIAFMGTTVAMGNGMGIVVATGMQTEIGHIASLSQKTGSEPSPLQKELNHLAKKVALVAFVIAAGLFVVGLFLQFSFREAFLFALGVAASCVPEGTPAQISVALSLAAGRLAKKNAVIKQLAAVETLGATHVICTDKTGTLTTNEMTVQKIIIGREVIDVTGIGYKPEGEFIGVNNQKFASEALQQHTLFFQTGVFASNARVNPPDEDHHLWYAMGDPTEAALITLAEKAGISTEKIRQETPELQQFTFDGVRKRMSSVRLVGKEKFLYMKGAPLRVLEQCTHILDKGKIRPIKEEDKKFIQEQDDALASMALRNLAFAYRKLPSFSGNIAMEEAEEKLVFLGLVAMLDPPREEVKEAMETAQKAHMRVIIITGDYALTAAAIAQRIGLVHNQDDLTIITGQQIQQMTDIELLDTFTKKHLIFSRTSPEDKLRIVTLLKKAGFVIAVTGDGVNDAPALKKADIGVAMGKTGTEVAKDSAQIVLLDDSFATLVSAIKEGRVIFQNLKKTIFAALNANAGELFAVLLSLPGSIIFDHPIAILAVQILAIDLVAEMFPLACLTWDPPQKSVMEQPPRSSEDHIINKKSLIDLGIAGFFMGGIAFANYLLLFWREGVSPSGIEATDPLYMRATTMTYVCIALNQFMNILSRRAGNETVFTPYLWSNKRLILGFLISIICILLIVYHPLINQYLYTAPLTSTDWLYAIAGAALYLLSRELIKIRTRTTPNPQETAQVSA